MVALAKDTGPQRAASYTGTRDLGFGTFVKELGVPGTNHLLENATILVIHLQCDIMSLNTYFRARLHCTRCGHENTVLMHRALGSQGATYEVGDCPGPDIPAIDFEDTSFTVRVPAANEPVHVLNWPCEYCQRENFAEVVFFKGFILDALGAVARMHTRDDLPEPWGPDPTLDAEHIKLWALYRES